MFIFSLKELMQSRVKLFVAFLFFSFTYLSGSHAKPSTYKQLYTEWNEVVLSKQAYDDKGIPMGEPEVEVFVNPKKCHYSVGQHNWLLCQELNSKLPQEKRPKFKVKPLEEVYGNAETTTTEPNKILRNIFQIPTIPKYHNILIVSDTVINPPRLDCPVGYRLDYFGNCKYIW